MEVQTSLNNSVENGAIAAVEFWELRWLLFRFGCEDDSARKVGALRDWTISILL